MLKLLDPEVIKYLNQYIIEKAHLTPLEQSICDNTVQQAAEEYALTGNIEKRQEMMTALREQANRHWAFSLLPIYLGDKLEQLVVVEKERALKIEAKHGPNAATLYKASKLRQIGK